MDQLALTETHIVQGERLIRDQREIIQILERGNRDVSGAKELLRELERAHATHVALREELVAARR